MIVEVRSSFYLSFAWVTLQINLNPILHSWGPPRGILKYLQKNHHATTDCETPGEPEISPSKDETKLLGMIS